MDNSLKSILLFIFGCIPMRLLLVYISKEYIQLLPYMSFISIIIALGFIVIYTFELRKSGFETFGQEIWWNNLRPVHAVLYLLFAYAAIYHKEHAWKILLLDILIGSSAFILKRILKIDF
jgi:hypothetical protein